MEFTITNAEGLPAFQIRPHNSECWELWEYRSVKEKDGGKATGRTGWKWVSMGKYPTTLSQACLALHEHILKRTDIDVAGYDRMVLEVVAVENRIKEGLRCSTS